MGYASALAYAYAFAGSTYRFATGAFSLAGGTARFVSQTVSWSIKKCTAFSPTVSTFASISGACFFAFTDAGLKSLSR